MKKLRSIAIGTAILLAGSGCGGATTALSVGSTTTSAVSTTQTTPTTTQSPPSVSPITTGDPSTTLVYGNSTQQQNYLQDLANANGDSALNNLNADVAVALGEGSCNDLAAGDTWAQYLADIQKANTDNNLGLSGSDWGDILGYAVKDLCPSLAPQAQVWLAPYSSTTQPLN